MHEIRPFIKSNLNKSITERIREEYPDLVEFLRAYFDYLEQVNESGYYLNRIDQIRDIDLTLDKFLPEIKKEFSLSTPSYYTDIDQRNVFKRIKEFFISRGSSESIDAFFKFFFDDQAELEYPKDKILIPSDGEFDSGTAGEVYQLFEETGLDSSEIFEPRYFFRNVGEPVFVYVNGTELNESQFTLDYTDSSDSTARGQLHEIIPPYDQSTGNSFGQRFNIPFESRDPNHSEVYLVLEDGSIETKIAGTDYEIGDVVVSSTPTGLPNDMTKTSLYFYDVLPGNCVIRVEYASSIKEKILVDPSVSVNPTGNTFTAYKEATGFLSNHGFLSDDIYIQDSYFYQAFSYIIKTGVDPSVWQNGFNRLIHPGGFLYFIQLVLNIYLLKTDFDPADVWFPAYQPGRQFGGGLIIYIPPNFSIGTDEYEANRILAGGGFAAHPQSVEKYVPVELNIEIGDQTRYYNEYTYGVYNDLENKLGPSNNLDPNKFNYPDNIGDFGSYTIQQAIDEEIQFNPGSFVYTLTSTEDPETVEGIYVPHT